MFPVNTPRLPPDQNSHYSLLASHQRSEKEEKFHNFYQRKISSLFGRQSVDLTHVARFLDPLSPAKIRLQKKLGT